MDLIMEVGDFVINYLAQIPAASVFIEPWRILPLPPPLYFLME